MCGEPWPYLIVYLQCLNFDLAGCRFLSIIPLGRVEHVRKPAAPCFRAWISVQVSFRFHFWTVSIKKHNAVQRMYDLAFEFSVYLDILQVDKRNVFINLLCLYLAMHHSVCVSNALQMKSMSIVKVDYKHT